MEQPTNETLKMMIENNEKRSDEKHVAIMDVLKEVKDDVKETKTQAQKTNGRVDRHAQLLESYPENMKALYDVVSWKKYFIVAIGALWTILLIVFPLMWNQIKNFIISQSAITAKQTAQKTVVELQEKLNIVPE